MSFIATRFVPTLRNISPKLRQVVFRCNAIQRNYWRRRDTFSELSTAVRSIENVVREMDKAFGSFMKFPRSFAPFDLDRVREIPVVSTGKGRSYKLELDMEGMEPENINITLKDRELSISARRDEKHDDGSRFVRENAYHYTLPSEINPDTIRSSFTDGILTIEAPLPDLESKEIPINIRTDSDSEKNK